MLHCIVSRNLSIDSITQNIISIFIDQYIQIKYQVLNHLPDIRRFLFLISALPGVGRQSGMMILVVFLLFAYYLLAPSKYAFLCSHFDCANEWKVKQFYGLLSLSFTGIRKFASGFNFCFAGVMFLCFGISYKFFLKLFSLTRPVFVR